MQNLGYKRRVLWYFPEWPIERGDKQDGDSASITSPATTQPLTMFVEGKRKYKRGARTLEQFRAFLCKTTTRNPHICGFDNFNFLYLLQHLSL